MFLSVSSLDCYVCDECNGVTTNEMTTVKCPVEKSSYCVVKFYFSCMGVAALAEKMLIFLVLHACLILIFVTSAIFFDF